MSDLAQQDPDKEMRARWENLRNSSKVWRDHATAEEFEWGLLHPQLARELYTLPSEVLLARAAKKMVLINNLLQEIDVLKAGAVQRQWSPSRSGWSSWKGRNKSELKHFGDSR
ncbi:hypothetical protein BHM03_00055824, partial [Ensete ventricosum]